MEYYHQHSLLQQCLICSQSIINVQNQPVEMDQDKCKTFLQKYDQELRHFGKSLTISEASNKNCLAIRLIAKYLLFKAGLIIQLQWKWLH